MEIHISKDTFLMSSLLPMSCKVCRGFIIDYNILLISCKSIIRAALDQQSPVLVTVSGTCNLCQTNSVYWSAWCLLTWSLMGYLLENHFCLLLWKDWINMPLLAEGNLALLLIGFNTNGKCSVRFLRFLIIVKEKSWM